MLGNSVCCSLSIPFSSFTVQDPYINRLGIEWYVLPAGGQVLCDYT
jgi:hypothetical protein